MESNIEQNIFVFIKIMRYSINMTMNSCSAIFRAFTKDRETAVDQKINAIDKQLSVITKIHAKDMNEMKALIDSISNASVENLKVDNSIKEEIKDIKEEDKKKLADMIANVEKELNDAREELEKLQPTPKLAEEIVIPIDLFSSGVDVDVKLDLPGGVNDQFTRPQAFAMIDNAVPGDNVGFNSSGAPGLI
jgi:ATP-dependent Lon protease